MNIFIKESLYLLDYNDNILDVLFLSTDKDTPGQAYEINIKENNTGYSDLTFKMPSVIVDENGNKIINPKLQVLNRSVEGLKEAITSGLIPLSKVRYERLVRYMGKETIDFPGPNNTIVTYPKNDGLNPEDYIIEDYIMDYIIQPLDKARQSLKVDLTYTAIDYPRFNLSKKKLGFTTDQNTITTPELSLYTNAPMNIPGKVTYIPWSLDLVNSFQSSNQVANASKLQDIKQPEKGEVYYVESVSSGQSHYFEYDGTTWNSKDASSFLTWSPNPQSGGYPLTEASIQKLIHQTVFTNGVLAVVYYWPVVIEGNAKTARFEGVTYEQDSYITLSLYNTYEGIETSWTGSEYLEDIAWDWNYLEPTQLYLNPNNACNLLRYILKNTNWNVTNDGGAYFKANTSSTPWYTSEPHLPTTGYEEGTYYIIQHQGSGIRPYTYTIMQLQNGQWVDNTTMLSPIVNTDETDITNFGIMYDVDIEQVPVSRTKEGNYGQNVYMDARYSLNISNGNCYNAITAMAKLFDLYPIFDCVNKTVSLKLNAGADYGLVYRAGRNLKTSGIKLDGEKVITKLYTTGGQDTQGSTNINLGEAERTIEGTYVTIQSKIATDALNTNKTSINENLRDKMKTVQQLAYDNLVGKTLNVNNNYTNNELLLSFPDTLAYTTLGITPYNNPPTTDRNGTYIVSNRKNMIWKYDATSHCFYVYFSGDNYLDETKQLYKFDFTNVAVRRNRESWPAGAIGTVTSISVVNNYVRYTPGTTMSDPNYLFQKDKGYIGYSKLIATDGSFILDTIPTGDADEDDSFVLVGPTAVYEADNTTQAFTAGKYYHMNGHYYYCAGQTNLQHSNSGAAYYNSNGSLDNINAISVNGYIFIDFGTGAQDVTIQSNGTTYTIQKKNSEDNVTIAEWMSSGFAIRVIENDGVFQEVYPLNEDTGEREFNPNAPEYLIGRSPYGTSYIYNFKYLYDNEWMTEDQIMGIYRIDKQIHADNLDFFNRYAQELTNARAAYLDAINNLELYESKGDAQLETLMSQYWQNPMVASKGKFSAFPAQPKLDHTAILDENKHMYKTDIYYNDEKVKTVYYNVYNSAGTNYLYPEHKEGPSTSSKAENPETEGQYHVVAKALGWATYYSGKLPITTTYSKPDNVLDPSDTVTNYNKIINNMKLYYYKAKKANEELNEALQTVEELEEAYNTWQDRISSYEKYLQENYGQYIIEGSYNNNEQPYANLLLLDGLDASDDYAIPSVTYNVNVVDATGMIEYRAPQMLVCNDLVKKLHGLGQVVPTVGDYVLVYDNEMGLLGVKGLITGITRRIDDPYQNALTIDTSYTDADELVGQIITATNTVLNNKDIYGRAAIINNKGELQTTTVTDALSTGKNSISITSTNGKITVDNNGLTAVNPESDQYIMRYNGSGILGSNNGGVTWRSLMTQDGINANYIDAGTINTQKVSISDGQYDTVFLDGNGLVVKQNGGQNYMVGVINPTTLEAQGFSNVKVYIGKDANMNGIGYFDGYINATSGGNIAGWKLTDKALWVGTNKTNPIYYLGSEPISYKMAGDTLNRNYILKIADNFGVTSTGDLWASGNIYIKGGGTSKIGPWTITETAYYNQKSSLSDSSNGVYLGIDGIALGANSVFKVTNAGALTAKSGTIGGWTIGTDKLSSSKVTLTSASGDSTKAINVNSGTFYVQNNGYVYAKSGKIGGWTLSDSDLSGGKLVTGTSTDGWVITKNYIKSRKSTGNGRANFFTDGRIENYPSDGGRFLVGSKLTVNAHGGILLASNTNGNINAPGANIDIKACSQAHVYIGCMNTAGGGTELAALDVANGWISCAANDVKWVDKGQKKTDYGRTGYVTFQVPPTTGTVSVTKYMKFIHGALVGVVSTAPSGWTKLA